MLVISRKKNEAVLLKLGGVEVRVSVVSVGEGGRVKLGFQAPLSVVVVREELEDGK
jgi:carbon storage regulator CsrA